jgi:hypothetical protein
MINQPNNMMLYVMKRNSHNSQASLVSGFNVVGIENQLVEHDIVIVREIGFC